MTQTHLPECTKAMNAALDARTAYLASNPCYCRTCEGTGGFTRPGAGPMSYSGATPDEFDLCGDCADRGKCPVCACDTDDDGLCAACGADPEPMPATHECLCWETDQRP